MHGANSCDFAHLLSISNVRRYPLGASNGVPPCKAIPQEDNKEWAVTAYALQSLLHQNSACSTTQFKQQTSHYSSNQNTTHVQVGNSDCLSADDSIEIIILIVKFRLSFTLLSYSIMCIRGARSTPHHPVTNSIYLQLAEGQVH